MSIASNLGARVAFAGRSFAYAARIIARAFASGPAMTNYGSGGWRSLFAPHEPFAGAWQRNVEECRTDNLLAFSGVFACVSIISSDMAKLPVRIMRRKEGGGREEVPQHPASILLNRPNSYQTRVDFIQQFMASVLITGNGYAYKERDARRVVSALHYIDPTRVQPAVTESGEVYYRINDSRLSAPQSGQRDGQIVVPQSEILHHRVFTLAHPLIGLSPLFAGASSAAVGARITMNSQQFFANAARPSGVLSAPGKISKDTAERLKETWEQNYGAHGTGRTAVLGEGLEWKPLTMTAADAQLIEQLRWSVEDVARCFRVPSFLLGDMTKATYRNSEQLMRLYYAGCLQFHIEALEARLDSELELKAGNETDFDLDALLRTDSDTRMDTYQKGIQSGVLAINDARKREDLAPVEGGDAPFIQSQYVPVAVAAKATEKPAPSGAPAPALPAPAPDDDEELDDEPTGDDEARALALALIGRAAQ